MVSGGGIGDFGGGWLERPKQRHGAQWAGGLFLGVTICPEPPGALRGAEPSWGAERARAELGR